MKTRLLLQLLIAALFGAAAPAFAKDLVCQFQARGLTMNFGALDPSKIGVNAVAPISAATLNADMVGDCQSVTLTISADNGARLLKNSANSDVIPYSLVGLPISQTAPASGNNHYQAFSFSGLILWSSYANASAGTYSDAVMISVTP